MNRKFALSTLMVLATLGAQAGVKVTSLDLKTNGPNGFVNITLEGRSNELPDFKVIGKTIEITLSDADAFSTISKTVSGAELKANSVQGKAVITATLPYELESDKVNLGWKNKNIEVSFPRGKVAKNDTEGLNTIKPKAIEKKEPVLAKKEIIPSVSNTPSVAKESLNEEYLNNLMKAEVKKTEPKADEVKVQQSSIAKAEEIQETKESLNKNDNFSFAGYAAKFAGFLALVLGIFYGVVQVLKKGVFNRGKLGFLNNSQMIQVLSTTYVSPKRSLMVVKVHQQIFLIANSESGITFLSEMNDTTGLIKEGEKQVTGTNFDVNLGAAEITDAPIKLKENINESTPIPEKGIAGMSAKDIVKFSDELKKKAKKLKPIEFN